MRTASAKVRECERANVGCLTRRVAAPRMVFALALFGAAVMMGGCKRHEKEPVAAYVTHSEEIRDTAERLRPGPAFQEPEALRPRGLPVQNPYGKSRKAVQEGRRLYHWMNCKGCHGEGGGGIGPTLWDDQWRYGGRDIDIAESILYGRPNGMPAFAGHLPEDHVWKIVAYVQSLEPRGGPYHAGVK